jgi:hypothetical protein
MLVELADRFVEHHLRQRVLLNVAHEILVVLQACLMVGVSGLVK